MNEIQMGLMIFFAGILILGYMFMENIAAIVSQKLRRLFGK